MDSLRVGFSGLANDIASQRQVLSQVQDQFRVEADRLKHASAQTDKNFRTVGEQLGVLKGQSGTLKSDIGFQDMKTNFVADRVTVLEGEFKEMRERQALCEEGTLKTMMERLEKLERRLAEKDEEIVELRRQVCPLWCVLVKANT